MNNKIRILPRSKRRPDAGTFTLRIIAAAAALLVAPGAFAQSFDNTSTSNLTSLENAIRQTSGVSILQVFPGPSGLTGVLMLLNGHKMISYLTPDGRTWISGYLLDLQTGQNITATDAAQYAGSGVGGVPRALVDQVLEMSTKLSVASPVTPSQNVITVVLDPAAPQSLSVLQKTLSSAQHPPTGLGYAFAPIGGPDAQWVLSAPPADRMARMTTLAENQYFNPPPSQITAAGIAAADANSALTAHLAVHPPFLILNLPGLGVQNIVQAGPAADADQMGLSAVATAASSLASVEHSAGP